MVKQELYTCAQCSYSTLWEFALSQHTKNCQKLERPSRTFSCSAKISNNYKCDWCNFETSLRISLFTHVTTCHAPHNSRAPEPEYKCEKCEFRTSSQLVLLKHKDNCYLLEREVILCKTEPYYPKVKWFQCDDCNYITKYRCALKQHRRRHAHGRLNLLCLFMNTILRVIPRES
jgi:hypothetical protein